MRGPPSPARVDESIVAELPSTLNKIIEKNCTALIRKTPSISWIFCEDILMKILKIFSMMILLSLPSLGKLPADHLFFKGETVVDTYTIKGASIRMISTAKNFATLNLELKEFLGEGWVTEKPKEIKDPTIKKKAEENGLTTENMVIYVDPANPKLRVSLALTELPGSEDGESIAMLTIARDFVGN